MLTSKEYMQYDGLGLANLVKSKQVRPDELLQTAIQRCEQVNPKLNAVIIPMYEQAQRQLKARTGEALDQPFTGVPFCLKTCFRNIVACPPAMVPMF